jgi:cytochrome c556
LFQWFNRFAPFRTLKSWRVQSSSFKVKTAAQDLADAAKAKDEVEVRAKLKALGEACDSCDKSFRALKKAS